MEFLTSAHLILLGIVIIQSIALALLWFKKKHPSEPNPRPPVPEEKYRDLFENANDAIFILDKDQNYLDVNPRAVELFGFSKAEFLKMNVMDVIPTDQVIESAGEFCRLRENGKYEKFIGKQKTRAGNWLDIEVNSSLIRNNAGETIGSRDIVRDITERKRAEQERETIITDLHKALKEIKTLRGILPLCSFCKQIRDPKGDWKRVDDYIDTHSEADISHTICPDCMQEHYSEYLKD